MKSAVKDFQALARFFYAYFRIKILKTAHFFEKVKNVSVDILMLRRGMLQKRIWHTSMITLSAFGIITSGTFGNQTIVSPTFAQNTDPRFASAAEKSQNGTEPRLESLYDTHTTISKKPRSEIIEYEVKSGDTVSTIAEKFGISQDSVNWANNFDSALLIKPGQKIKILPVSGVSHTVVSGDTLESVAKKYSAESQAILDFPFNDIGDDFKLKIGQILIVPDGVPPKAPITSPRSLPKPQYLAQGPSSPTFSAPGGASFVWPTSGGITQSFAWYHPGIDIANKGAPAVAAAEGGQIMVAGWPDNWGYGNRVVIDHGNGYHTTYAHLSNIYVTSGQTISRGQIIGRMGTTGRSTGTHLHFEIHYKGIAVNPLSILK